MLEVVDNDDNDGDNNDEVEVEVEVLEGDDERGRFRLRKDIWCSCMYGKRWLRAFFIGSIIVRLIM